MNPLIGGALIGVGGSLFGGLLGKGAADDSRDAQQAMAERNIALQREFAQHGIRWRVEDAKAAGLHPLYALGANTASFSPISVGDGPDLSMANAVSSMGQDIGRAVSATKTELERKADALTLASLEQDVIGKQLQNSILAKQSTTTGQVGPAMPSGNADNFIPGQGNSSIVTVKPAERTASQTGRLAQEAGWVPDVGYARTDTGLTPVPSRDVKERIEDQFIPETMWAIRNQFTPNLGLANPPPKSQLPRGAFRWIWNYGKQEWQPQTRQQYLRENYERSRSRKDFFRGWSNF